MLDAAEVIALTGRPAGRGRSGMMIGSSAWHTQVGTMSCRSMRVGGGRRFE